MMGFLVSYLPSPIWAM